MKRRRRDTSIAGCVKRLELLIRLRDQIHRERDPVKLLRLVERFSRAFDRGVIQ